LVHLQFQKYVPIKAHKAVRKTGVDEKRF